jgi:tetratricopeptide (TPR) repeat protein
MEQMAKPGSTLITADALKLAEGYVQVKPLGAVPVKGLETPTPVYELTGIVPTRSRFQASVARGLTRFVGREGELQQLCQALERAAAGHGQAVAVVGEAGVGKSRLVWEFTRSHRTQGWLVLESGSVSYGKATPYLPVIELLKGYCRIQERDEPREIPERVAGKLLTLDGALLTLMTPILALLDVTVDDAAWAALDPPQRRQRTLEAVKRLLLRESQIQPLLLIFEDLHWIDSETQALLDSLMESLPTAGVLLLVTYRPEYQHKWGGKPQYLRLQVDPLPRESAQELLETLLGADGTLEALKRALIGRTEGNPFFLEESVQALMETQVLAGKRGACRLTKAPGLWQIPATTQAILAARIDRLAPEDKRLLQTAAVIGKDLPLVLLQTIADLSEERVRQGLTHLQTAEFLYETSLFPDVEYTFKHALTHEVAYGSLLHQRRRELHARIVGAIEQLYPERLPEHCERLAYHAFRGELWERAVDYSREAAAKAASRSAHREAVAFLEQALATLRHLPETRHTVELSIDLRFDLRSALIPLGEFGRIGSVIQEAGALATTLHDRRRLGWVSGYEAHLNWIAGDQDRAVESGQRALSYATEVDDFDLAVLANFYVGVAYHAMGDYGAATPFFTRTVASLSGDLVHKSFGLAGLPSVMSRGLLVWCLAERGNFAEGLEIGRHALRIAQESDRSYTLISACFCVGIGHLRQGEHEPAIALLERAVRLARDRGVPALAPWAGCSLGYAYALSGRTVEAVALLIEGVERNLAMKSQLLNALWLSWLADAYLLGGRLDDAWQCAGRALTLARDRHEFGHEAHILRVQAEISAHPSARDAEMAERHFRQAAEMASQFGMLPLVAHCHLGLGKLYRRTGKHEQAQGHLATATTMYREMGMTYWLEKAETQVN